ncbi:MAG: DoxX family protein [Planctomycetota bacterium]|jgi:uncharacterized membrane protein YphA (DoxX/SURF4 family)
MSASSNLTLWRRMDDTGVPLLVVRLIIGLMFLWMGYVKIQDPATFLKLINQYEVVSFPLFINSAAIVLPWIELVAGMCLLLGVLVRGAALAALIMLSVFTPAILFRALAMMDETGMAFMAIEFDCGCGGGPTVIWTKLLENASLWVAAFIAMVSRSRRFCVGALRVDDQGGAEVPSPEGAGV